MNNESTISVNANDIKKLSPRTKLLINNCNENFLSVCEEIILHLSKNKNTKNAVAITFIIHYLTHNKCENSTPSVHLLYDLINHTSKHAKYSIATVRTIINELITHGLLVEKVVTEGSSNRKMNAVTMPDLIGDLHLAMDSYLEKTLEKKNPQPLRNKSNIKILKHDLAKFPTSVKSITKRQVIEIRSDDLSLGSILSGICPPEKTSVVHGKLMPIENSGKTTGTSAIDFTATTWSDSDSIMLFSDITYYHAVITLVYFAHIAKLSQYQNGIITPKNRTHIHIDDILTLFHNSDNFGGHQRSQCREALQRIKKTTINLRPKTPFDFSNLIERSNGETKSGRTEIFLRPFKDLKRVDFIDSHGAFGESTMDFVVELPDEMFKKLFSEKFHWLLPPTALSIYETFFSIYMWLRKVMYNRTEWEFSLQDFYVLNMRTVHSLDLDDFYLRFQSELEKKARGSMLNIDAHFRVEKLFYKNEYRIQLFGYNCEIDFHSRKMVARLNPEDFNTASKLNEARETPTLSNPLSDNRKRSRISQALKTEDEGFGYVVLSLGNPMIDTFIITTLSNDNQLNEISRKISNRTEFLNSEVSEYINRLNWQVSRNFCGKNVSDDVIEKIYQHYLVGLNISKDSPSEQLSFLMISKNNQKLFREWMNIYLND
jgi:hypothetical protein